MAGLTLIESHEDGGLEGTENEIVRFLLVVRLDCATA